MYIDPSGEFALSIPFLPAIVIVVVALLVVSMFSDEIAEVVESAINVIANATETAHTRKHQDDYSVYICYDKQGELFYVGISNDVERRMGEHMRNLDFLIQYGGRYDVRSETSH